MKILVLSNLYPPHYIGGYELRCRQITEALRSRGHEVHVLTSDHGVKPGQALPETAVERRLRVHGFFGHPWLGINHLRELEFHNNHVLREVVERVKPEVVHVWNMGGISKSLLFTLRKLGVPTVFDVSDHWIARSLVGDVWLRWWNRSDPSVRHRLLRAWWMSSGFRATWDAEAPTNPIYQIRFQRLYFCSQALRTLTSDVGYSVDHAAVIYCPVDLERFKCVAVPTVRDIRNLLYVGRLAEDKGIMTALRAMVRVKGRFQGELHVYGKGDAAYTDQLRSFVTTNSLPVTFASATAEEMPSVYQSHDALLFTSEWEEPFALTPLEAMACGLPVIGTTTGGSKELLRDGENALTYTAGNDQELAERILTLAEHPSLAPHMASRGLEDVKQFALPLIVDQIEEYLRQTPLRWVNDALPRWDQ